MLNLKNYFVAVILTGLILALAFNRLAGSQTSPSAQYDPWADLNDDGKISMDEIVKACELFGTTGDPTKNVNVTNWPLVQNVNVTNWPVLPKEIKMVWGYYYWRRTFKLAQNEGWSFINRTAGYQRMFILWTASYYFNMGFNYYIAGKLIRREDPTQRQLSGFIRLDVNGTTEIRVEIYNLYSSELDVDLAVYVTASNY
jgi:hypothetical protein